MIIRRFGSSVGAVTPAFDARAMTEVAFNRAPGFSMQSDEFFESYERVGEKRLTAEAEGDVQLGAEEAVLARLRGELDSALAALGPREVLLVESEPGTDYPKTRERVETLVVEGENRLRFYWRIEPALRLGVYRPRAGAAPAQNPGAV